MQRFLTAVCAGAVLVAAATTFAQDANSGEQRPVQEVRKLLTAVEEGFSQGDAAKLAACWTATGDFSGPAGERVEGRANIEKTFREFFADRKAGKLTLRVASLRLVGNDLALLDAICEVKPNAAEAATETSVLSFVLVNREGRWLVESAREGAATAAAPTDHLKPLAWLVGHWADETAAHNGISVRSTCDWTANHAYLIRKFKVEGRPDVSRSGTEIIGWDPHTRRIRSWVFDSDGGFGQNFWVKDGDRWLVSYSGVRPDGVEVSATNILAPVDADTMTIQSRDRMANGERQRDVPVVTVKRQQVVKAGTSPKEPKPQQVLP